MKRHAWALLLGLAVIVFSAPAAAQQPTTTSQDGAPTTIASSSDAAQETGGGDGFVDGLKAWADRHQIIDRLNGDVDGWYPRLGGMTRGAGFALGPGYRLHVGDVLVDVSAGFSLRNYKAVDAKVRWIRALDDKFEFWTDYRFEDFPQEDFFGTGPSSLLDERTSYQFKSHDFVARGLLKPVEWLRVGANLGYLRPSIGRGRDDRFASIEEVFSDIAAPGLATQPNFLHTALFADVDTLDERGNPRDGGLYRIAYSRWDAREDAPYDFRRFDVNAERFVPLVASKDHMVMGRFGLAYVNNETGDRVPFYFLPYVGGVDTVRSYREFRFKDENAMWLSAEYNYRPMKWVSLAAFIDRGKVAADWEDINFSDMKKAYGFGFRVHSRKQTFLRVDYGMGGGEGRELFFKLGKAF